MRQSYPTQSYTSPYSLVRVFPDLQEGDCECVYMYHFVLSIKVIVLCILSKTSKFENNVLACFHGTAYLTYSFIFNFYKYFP